MTYKVNNYCFSAVTDDITQKVSASANYIGSIFSSAWTKTAKTANDATVNSSTFLTSAFTKVTGVFYREIYGTYEGH